jgi:hypothetical protein
MTDDKVLEFLQELYSCKPATKDDLEEIKALYESNNDFKIVDTKVYDEAGRYVADVEYYN